MMRTDCAALRDRAFDILVVGGGIVGCGIARDAALRGLSVCLLEREDYGSGTTSRSTRLIHGGLRYLEMLDFGLVREDMREREILLRIAPHLVRPLPFLVPMYRWPAWKRDRLRVGMVLYDALSYDKSLPWHRFLTREDVLREEPSLNPAGLRGAARYFDCQVEFPERLALANLVDAVEQGAKARNHTVVERFLVEENRVVGVEALDALQGERFTVRARLTINATGPWLDRSLGALKGAPRPLLRTTKGVHLLMPRLSNNAILLIANVDNRVFFVVPWFGHSMVGTTDTDYADDPAGAQADESDVAYLLRETVSTFPSASALPVYYGMAGVRALVRKEGVHESRVSRKHALLDHGRKGGPEGLISVLGGKITAYRHVAAEVTDLASRKLGWRARASTAQRALPGGDQPPEAVFAALWPRARELGLGEAQTRHLIAQHGTRAEAVLSLVERDRALAASFCPHGPTIRAQVAHAALHEGAVTLPDVLLRRAPIGLASCLALDCVEQAATTVGDVLGWDRARREAEVEGYRALVARQYAAPIPALSLRASA